MLNLTGKFIGVNVWCLSVNYRENSANNFTTYIV